MRKVVIISNTAWNLYNFRLGLMNELKKKGFKIICAAPEDDYTGKLKELGFDFRPIKNLSRKGMNPWQDLKFLWELSGIYKREKPDVAVHFTIKPNIYGSLVAKFSGVKNIAVVTGLGYLFIKKGIFMNAGSWLYKLAFNYVDICIFHNEDDSREFVEKSLLKKEKSLVISGSGVNTNYFSEEFCKAFKKNKHKIIFLYVGRILADKGLRELAEAAKNIKVKFPVVEIQLLGGFDKGNPAGISERELESWNEDVTYLGSTDDVRMYYCQADVFVLPSYREGASRVHLEAMSMGLPVITTDVPGCRSLTEDGIDGLIIPAKDAQALGKAMEKMIEMGEQKRKEMGKAGREKVFKKFDEKIIVEQYIKAIENLVEEN